MKQSKLLEFAQGKKIAENRSFVLVIQADEQGQPVLSRGFAVAAELKPPRNIIIRTPGLTVSEPELKKWNDKQIETLSKS